MVYSANRPRQMARYEYDIFGNCTVYDENNKVNADPNFIGNINPFRWKGFYYDAESGLYYANGSYYDPSTGLYVDAAPIESVIENGLSSNRLDRNGLVCNNILELASNPSTVFNVTELHSDPTYDVTDKFPDWMKRQIKRQEKINKILRWYQDLHWGWKLGVGIALLIGAIGFTVATGGGGAGVISVLVQTAIGVGVGVGLYTVGSLMSESFTVEGLADAALNAFLITSATVFISSAVNYIKYACRSKPVSTAELKAETIKDMSYDDMLPNEKVAYDGYSKHGWRGNYPGQQRGIKAGSIYKNKTGILPDGTYHEFDINIAVQGIGRDASRFVVSNDYVVYLTRDHYTTFFRIIT